MVPQKLFLTKGMGVQKEKLQSFEKALRSAGIEKFNLVRVSSIYPPDCRIVSKKAGLQILRPGQIVYCVLASRSTNESNRMVAASIGLAMPRNTSQYGYLSEHTAYGENEEKAGDYAEDLAACMLATTLGIDYDEEVHWDARKELWKINDQIYRTRNITQTAMGNKKGLWTTVVSAAVFIL